MRWAGGGDRTRCLSGTGRASYLQDLTGVEWAEVEWAEGIEPSPSAWGADVLSVDTTPTRGGLARSGRPAWA